MISYLTGKVISKSQLYITLLTSGGVGYDVYLSKLRVLETVVNSNLDVHVYMKVSDTNMQLFGFIDTKEREFFSKLISVKSVGPKSAMHILSLGSVDEIQGAITRGDVKYLTTIQGMGKKTAERIVVELKGKLKVNISHDDSVADGEILRDVVDALVSMGYTKEEARSTVKNLDSKDKTTDMLIREALSFNAK
jgi:holliday junction DNA helicase RuvA